MTYDELVEKVARAMKPTTSSIVDRLIEIGADRLEAIQLLPLQDATVAIATIREVLMEPTPAMEVVVSKNWGRRTWSEYRDVLAASPLGEKKG